ncbi:MAG: hypothetical protein Kow0090_11990 [Myxococcota bacterium]
MKMRNYWLFFSIGALIFADFASAQNELAEAAKKRGDAMLKANLLDDAIREYEAAVAADPNHFEAYKGLGTVYFKKKDFNKAGDAFEKAVGIKPDFATGHYNMGFAYRKGGNHKKAITGYANYIRLKPDDPDAYFGIADCYENTGDIDNAIANYEKYVQIEKRESEQKWVETAKAKIEELKKKKSQSPPPAVAPMPSLEMAAKPAGAFDKNLSKAMEKEGDAHMIKSAYNLAITSYRDATVRDPQNDSAHYKLGVAYEKTGRLSLAQGAYQSALAANPNHFEAKERLEKVEEMIKSGGEPAPPGLVIEKVGGSAEELYKQGLAENQKGEYKKALALFDQAITLKVNFAEAHVAKGDALMGLGKFNEAIHSYTQGMSIDPRLAAPLFGLGEAYRAIGDKTRAKQYLERFLNLEGPKQNWRVSRAKQTLEMLKRGE